MINTSADAMEGPTEWLHGCQHLSKSRIRCSDVVGDVRAAGTHAFGYHNQTRHCQRQSFSKTMREGQIVSNYEWGGEVSLVVATTISGRLRYIRTFVPIRSYEYSVVSARLYSRTERTKVSVPWGGITPPWLGYVCTLHTEIHFKPHVS